MKVYFVRHGHSDHNAAFDKLQDVNVYRSLDYKYSKLTEKGVKQIKDVVLSEKVQRVYSSPITRCIDTSRLLVGDDTVLHLHDGLMEIQGPYPCNWRPDIDTFHKSLQKYNLKNVKEKYTPYTDYFETDISEPWDMLRERATNTLRSILQECDTLDSIMIVTHNDWLESLFKRSFMNGEVYCVEYKKYNDVNYII